MNIELKIKRRQNSKGQLPPMPKYATDGSAGMDLHAFCEEPVEIKPNELVLIETGLFIELPDSNSGAFIYARSGLGIKYGINLSNGVGVIDSDYRGELKVGLCNVSNKTYVVNPLDRIAQMVIMPVNKANIIEVNDLNETFRGAGGFGSTGK